jgi:hypothetical protein
MYHGQIGRAQPCHQVKHIQVHAPRNFQSSARVRLEIRATLVSRDAFVQNSKSAPMGRKFNSCFFRDLHLDHAPSTHFPLSLATLLVNVHPCACCTPRPSVARRANSKQRHQRRVCTKTVVRVPRPKRTCRARTRLPRPGNEISRRNLAHACIRRRF